MSIGEAVARLVEGRRPGESLTEPEAQRVAEALGIGTPSMVVASSPDEAAAASLDGDRVVVKVLETAHKTDVGGVQIVANTPEDIRAAASGLGGGAVLVAEFVPHDLEILAGVRWTAAFGPVATIGAGGVGVEEGPPPAHVSMATLDVIEATLLAATGGRRLVEGTRASTATVPLAALTDLTSRLLDLGATAMPDSLTEFEMNPVTFTPNGPVALDALAIVGGGAPTGSPRPTGAIARMLEPETIAVIGVSERMNPGRQIVRNVLRAGFSPDALTIVKAGIDELDGCRCVPSVDGLGTVDLLVVAVAAEAVEQVVREALGVARSIILIPGGVGERPGTENSAKRLQEVLEGAREGSRPVVTGPNSMGIRSTGYDATFISAERMTEAEATLQPVGVVAQSGAFTLSRLDRLPWLRPRHVVTVGNQIDLTVGDFLRYFADDARISVAAAYVEGLAPGDGTAALEAARRIRSRGGVLLWYRGGRTEQGARTAASHTAAIATDDRIARSLGAAAGIIEARSLDDFDDLLRLAVRFDRRPVGPAVGVVSNAGFETVAAADTLGRMSLAGLASETVARIESLLTSAGLAGFAGAVNPMDLTPMADDETFAAVVEAVLDDPGVDVGVIGCVPYSSAIGMLPEHLGKEGSLVERLADLATHSTPWVAVVDAGRRYDPAVDRLERAGIPVIRSMDRAVGLLGQYVASRAGDPRGEASRGRTD